MVHFLQMFATNQNPQKITAVYVLSRGVLKTCRDFDGTCGREGRPKKGVGKKGGQLMPNFHTHPLAHPLYW